MPSECTEIIDFSNDIFVFVSGSSIHVQNSCNASNFPLNHSNEQNDLNTNYTTHNGHGYNDFKQPLPALKNGSSRIPALALARSQAFDGSSLFHRSYSNKPLQTINPHYNRFGESSELSNFKTLPDLYPIKAVNRSNISYASQKLTNGYEQPLYTSNRHANDTLHTSNNTTRPPPPALALATGALRKDRSIFVNSYLNQKSTSSNTTMGSKSNYTSYNVSAIFFSGRFFFSDIL